MRLMNDEVRSSRVFSTGVIVRLLTYSNPCLQHLIITRSYYCQIALKSYDYVLYSRCILLEIGAFKYSSPEIVQQQPTKLQTKRQRAETITGSSATQPMYFKIIQNSIICFDIVCPLPLLSVSVVRVIWLGREEGREADKFT